MTTVCLERPAHAAPRVWVLRPGRVAELRVPPLRFRRRWGGRYGWGDESPQSALTAAVLCQLAGFTAVACEFLAPLVVRDVVSHCYGHTVRFELPVLKFVVATLANRHMGAFNDYLARRKAGGDRGQ